MLRQRDEAQGSEAAAVVGLTPARIVGRPLRRDPSGRLRAADPVCVRIVAGRIASVTALASDRPAPPGTAGEPAGPLGDDAALLLPAFADPHLHLVACAADRAGLDLSSDPPATRHALLARLAAAASRLPAGAWLRASGYDEAWLDDRAHPTRQELDAAVAGRPLRLRHATRHASLLNSDALARVERLCGTLDVTRTPRVADGTPGALVVGLEPEITRVVGPLAQGELERSLRVVGRELARHGVAHLDEVTASNDALRVARIAAAVASGDLPQSVRAFVGDPEEASAARRAADGRVTIAGVKLLARSTDEVNDVRFRTALTGARRRGLPVAVHAVEPDVTDAVLDALVAAPPRAGDGSAGPDRLEHCSLCPPELVRRIAAAGVAVVTQPAFLALRGDKYRREVEAPLWPWLYPLRALCAAGVAVAASSDAPVVPYDPRLGLDAAVCRTTRGGFVLAPDERLDDASALALFGDAAARLRGESIVGLAPGAAADLLVVEPESLRDGWRGLVVRHTIAAGRVIA